jgi:hypothetical protein
MSTQSSIAKYIELSNAVYELFLDTFASAIRGRIDYSKTVFDIASRPYPTNSNGSALRGAFARAGELTDVTVVELCSRVQRTADFSEKFLVEVEKLQDANLKLYRDSLTSIVSAVDQVKDTSADLVGDLKHSSVSTANKVKHAAVESVGDLKQPVVQSVSEIVDEVKDASTEPSVGGVKHRNALADHVPSN